MRTLILVGFVLGTGLLSAKPILDRVVGLSEPVFLSVHPDSENPDQFYFHPMGYDYCGSAAGTPEFLFKSFAIDGTPHTLIEYNLCPYFDPETVAKARKLLGQKNPSAVLSMLHADGTTMTGLWEGFKGGMDIAYHCSTVLGSLGQVVACQISTAGEEQATHLHKLFTEWDGLVANGFFTRVIAGVVQNPTTGQMESVLKTITVAFSVSGMKDHPELLKIGWRPTTH